MSVVVLAAAEVLELLPACLRGLQSSHVSPAEVLVVDSSPRGTLATKLADTFPTIRVVPNPGGPGARRRARRIGIDATSREVVAFLDGDAVPDPDWLGTLRGHFADPDIHGAGGRLLSRDLSRQPLPQLPGRVLADGRLAANFRVDTGRPALVDHLSGVNMAFRRAVVRHLPDREYPGTAQWEDADVCWQARQAGGQLIFDPRAVVHYEPGRPRVGGPRRSRPLRQHYAVRNNLALLLRRGAKGRLAEHFVRSTLRTQADHLHTASQVLQEGSAYGGSRLRDASQQLALIGGEVSGLVLGVTDGLRGRAAERAAADASGRQQ